MNSLAMHGQEVCIFKLVFDDRCAVVQRLAKVVRIWDRHHTFDLIGRNSIGDGSQKLLNELDQSTWSLLLVDSFNNRWSGPEAIPIILKNLPFGKIAAVLYILPGTMWLTRQIYFMVSRVSRNRRRFA